MMRALCLQVGRAACAALQACCETSSQRFEPLAIGLLPDLLKLLVISIVVVAEAAHSCMSVIVGNCHSSRMLKGIVDPLIHDKSPRLRQRCAEYLHQMLHQWPHTVLSRDVTLVSTGVTKAVEDASPGTTLLPCLLLCSRAPSSMAVCSSTKFCNQKCSKRGKYPRGQSTSYTETSTFARMVQHPHRENLSQHYGDGVLDPLPHVL